MTSHRLALRPGLMRQLAAGIYCYLSLGWRVVGNVVGIIREGMEAIGGQELSMSVVNPAEIWSRRPANCNHGGKIKSASSPRIKWRRKSTKAPSSGPEVPPDDNVAPSIRRAAVGPEKAQGFASFAKE